MREIKRRVERSQKPLPGLLAESDIDSDSDNESLSSDPVIDSGGDKVDERDFRSDHPRQMEEPPDNEADLGPPSQPEPPPSPIPQINLPEPAAQSLLQPQEGSHSMMTD
jgi:hypothetical protein